MPNSGGTPDDGGIAARGVAIGGPYASLPELARQTEARGFDAAWVSETTQESMIQAAVAAQATRRIDIGTNITLAFPRSPTVTAMQAWDLNELSNDRFVVGLGSQIRTIVEQRFSASFDQPAKRMAEYVQAMQTVWRMERGEDVTFRGDIYRVLRPGLGGLGRAVERALPRVHVAAVGPLMTRAAARHADGILGHPFTSQRYLTERMLPTIAAELADAGRSAQEFGIVQGLIVCIADDRERAIREAKLQIAFYGTTPNYAPVFAAHGDEALMGQLRDVWRSTRQDAGALIDAVPDEVAERYALAGTPADVADRYAELESATAARSSQPGVDQFIFGGAWYQVPAERMAENLFAILETLGR